MCGMIVPHEGSPPRAWGGLEYGEPLPVEIRFTPTGVGRTSTDRPGTRPTPVHPHGRGEDTARTAQRDDAVGSPPRAWGGLPGASSSVDRSRFTPTGVGRTRFESDLFGTSAVHPHGRGEDVSVASGCDAGGGSPPRAWGGRWLLGGPRHVVRFTPTGVGRTRVLCPGTLGMAVHPHGRGEDPASATDTRDAYGSPPRAWGGLRPERYRASSTRFTPTGVGRTAGCAR